MNRREMLGRTSAAWLGAGMGGVRGLAQASGGQGEEAEKADELRVGVIGAGSRGQELIRHLLHIPGVRIAGVCDIYQPRYEQVNKLTATQVPATRDYHELLEGTKLDAVFVASPIAMHSEHILAALGKGLPVYGEKAMAFTPEQCREVLRAAEVPGRIYQVGYQYRYAAWVKRAVEEIKKGRIGEPTHVYGYWHRNNDWRRSVPRPDVDGRLEHLINWRLYKETSGGLVTELGSHQIDIANWIFGAMPERVMGTTSIVRYRDGRTTGDNVQAVFQYPGGRRMFFSSLTDNGKVGNELWVYGTEGSVAITIEDATFYYEPRKTPMTVAEGEVVRHGITTGASYNTKGEMPYRGPGERLNTEEVEDPTLTACRAFVECVRTKQRPLADARVAFASGVAAAVANRAAEEEKPLELPQLETGGVAGRSS